MRKLITTAAATTLLVLTTGTAVAAPKSKLWSFWNTANDASTTTVDHSAWDGLLKRHIEEDDSGLNRFDYGALAESSEDRSALKKYIDTLSATDVLALSREEQLPYWINVYNAVTVHVVVENWPVGSIRDISDSLFTSGPWKQKLFSANGKQLTLNDVEHRILRPIFNDNRIHYAVNCASIGCPNLQADAFTRANTSALLDAGARSFVNSPRGAMITGGSLTVSSIYDWFVDDFGGNDAGVIAHLRKYAEGALLEKLKTATRIAADQYDWRINAPAGSAPGKAFNGSSDSGNRNGDGGGGAGS